MSINLMGIFSQCIRISNHFVYFKYHNFSTNYTLTKLKKRDNLSKNYIGIPYNIIILANFLQS